MWTLEALKRDYRIALIAGGRIDLAALNSFYGTSIGADDCQTLEIPLPWPLAKADWGAALRGALVSRGMRRYFDCFDVLINTYNIGDFGRPGIHFVADLSWDEALRRSGDPPPTGTRRLLHLSPLLRRGYLALSNGIAGPSSDRNVCNLGVVIANSGWTKEILDRRHGIQAQVLYPPVTMRAVQVPSERKLRRFVCVGRISPEKRIERMIEILKAVRGRGHDVELHIIGDAGDTAYGWQFEQRCGCEGGWIVLHGRQCGETKDRLIAESAFGIHARAKEPFGIAVAEMVKAGCITFAPAEGGPAEILGHDALLYTDSKEAVEKICAVLSCPTLLVALREHLKRQAEKFSVETFMRGIRHVVEDFIASRQERSSNGYV